MGQGALAIWGLRALSHCVGCSNHIQSANDSNFPWLKVGGQVMFNSHISFVCSGAKISADTCDIATLDTGVLLSGTCKKQNK